ncbi:hypothetical protein RRF57_008636 [Xylaria bambusicola]|uniref:Uncharacterized protein n=1 Tax=Xylaria bambusicola TaxID=326684 RepID=A0AAN7UPQ8_9PEZI
MYRNRVQDLFFTQAFFVLSLKTNNPKDDDSGYSLSRFAIGIFLGLLLLASWLRARLLRIFGALAVDLILDLGALASALRLQLLLQSGELCRLSVHADEAFKQFDLVCPDLLILDGLTVRSRPVDGRLENHG